MSYSRFTEAELNEFAKAITVPYHSTDLPGKSVYHGTADPQLLSVKSGPKNLGSGLGGEGLYLAFEEPLAQEYAEIACQFDKARKPIVLRGTLNPTKSYTVGQIKLASRYHQESNLKAGVLTPLWSADTQLKKFVSSHFDFLEIILTHDNYGINTSRFLVVCERAGSDCIQWQRYHTNKSTSQLKLQPIKGLNFSSAVQPANLAENITPAFWNNHQVRLNPANAVKNGLSFSNAISIAGPIILGGYFLKREINQQYHLNPHGHYIRDAVLSFSIDTIIHSPLMLLGLGVIPLMMAASMPNPSNEYNRAYSEVKNIAVENKSRRVTESFKDKARRIFHDHVLIDHTIQMGSAVVAKGLAQTVLEPFSDAATWSKDKCRDNGIMTPLANPEQQQRQQFALFKAHLDETSRQQQPLFFNYNHCLSNRSLSQPDLTQVSWAALGPEIAAEEKKSEVTAPKEFQKYTSYTYKPPSQNTIPINFEFNDNRIVNAKVDLSTLALQSIALDPVTPIFVLLSFAYTLGETKHKKEGQEYLATINKKSVEASTALNNFNAKCTAINNLPAPITAQDLSYRVSLWREAMDMLKPTRHSFKLLRDETNMAHRHKTDSVWFGRNVDDKSYDEIKNLHDEATHIRGNKKHRIGLLEKADKIHQTLEKLEAAIPKQAILDSMHSIVDQHLNQLANIISPLIQQFENGNTTAGELWNKLSTYVEQGEKIKNTTLAMARATLQNDPSYLASVDTDMARTTEINANAAKLVAVSLYNKHFTCKDQAGFISIDPVIAQDTLSHLKNYATLASVNAVSDLIHTTITNSFMERCAQIDLALKQPEKNLLECLATIGKLEAEANAYTVPALMKPMHDSVQQLLFAAKLETLNTYQSLVNTDNLLDAETLLAKSFLTPSEQKDLKLATEQFLADKFRQTVALSLETANHAINTAHHLLSIFAETKQIQHLRSAPSIPTAKIQSLRSVFWRSDSAPIERISSVTLLPDPLSVKKDPAPKITKFKF